MLVLAAPANTLPVNAGESHRTVAGKSGSYFIAWKSGRILATLIRLLGDFGLAEDAVHDAFAAALERWPRDGVPDNSPRGWVSTGRFKAIDALRRRARFDASQEEIAEATGKWDRRRSAVGGGGERSKMTGCG